MRQNHEFSRSTLKLIDKYKGYLSLVDSLSSHGNYVENFSSAAVPCWDDCCWCCCCCCSVESSSRVWNDHITISSPSLRVWGYKQQQTTRYIVWTPSLLYPLCCCSDCGDMVASSSAFLSPGILIFSGVVSAETPPVPVHVRWKIPNGKPQVQDQ